MKSGVFQPQLEVLTRPNTCDDLCGISQEDEQSQTTAPDPTSTTNPAETNGLPPRIPASVSDPCLVPAKGNGWFFFNVGDNL